ncbi:MAG: gamma-glutamyl-gamma-aminobutyrate hydrolase family protein [Acidimicrobiales bacterium]
MSRPVVGLTAYRESARWGAWEAPAVLLPAAYLDQVAGAAGIPVVLPPEAADAKELAARLNGLVLTGGADVDPALYEATAHPKAGEPRPERDAAELAYLRAILGRDVPVLAICRGMQVLNVALGGSLHQHLPDVVGHEGHAPVPGTYGSHGLRVAGGSRLGEVVGLHPAPVPSHHHQAVDRLGIGLVAVAWADDETVEALEDPGHRFLIGVQWHPEVGEDPSLFRALVEAAGVGRGDP